MAGHDPAPSLGSEGIFHGVLSARQQQQAVSDPSIFPGLLTTCAAYALGTLDADPLASICRKRVILAEARKSLSADTSTPSKALDSPGPPRHTKEEGSDGHILRVHRHTELETKFSDLFAKLDFGKDPSVLGEEVLTHTRAASDMNVSVEQ
ncbi:unnamed protein product [Pleuronectes platessa]|uniref:Uncharacterized protein n=1 Tax=Pleuronectes platessa TaxID=8262 RepID=A0A9N7ZDG4_PLEPL|nr:unnamed protein product [Pleuronectes platessa]